jgi:hypothetical protein
MLLAVPKYILKGIALGVSAVVSGFLAGVVLKSITDAWKSLGIVAFLWVMGFLGAIVYFYYQDGGWLQGLYALCAVLLIHLIMWAIGFYRIRA